MNNKAKNTDYLYLVAGKKKDPMKYSLTLLVRIQMQFQKRLTPLYTALYCIVFYYYSFAFCTVHMWQPTKSMKRPEGPTICTYL